MVARHGVSFKNNFVEIRNILTERLLALIFAQCFCFNYQTVIFIITSAILRLLGWCALSILCTAVLQIDDYFFLIRYFEYVFYVNDTM